MKYKLNYIVIFKISKIQLEIIINKEYFIREEFFLYKK